MYFKFALHDDPSEDILAILDESSDFIDQAKAGGKCCLVHCSFGMSRSPSIVIAYLLRRENCSLATALRKVKECRPVTAPNTGFMKQLIRLESQLRGAVTIDIERYQEDRTANPSAYVIESDSDQQQRK